MVSVRREAGPGAKNLEVLLKGMKGLQGQVGWFPFSRYPDGTPVAYVASIQEFGSPQNRIPPRSFMRTTITEKQESWHKIVESGSKAVLEGRAQPVDVLEAVCGKAQEDIGEKISNIYEPELRPLTLVLRKFKLGLIKGMNRDDKIGGRLIGILAGKLARGEIDTSGVSTKPLIEPGQGGGKMLADIHSQVEQK
jgi:hypothetical protein